MNKRRRYKAKRRRTDRRSARRFAAIMLQPIPIFAAFPKLSDVVDWKNIEGILWAEDGPRAIPFRPFGRSDAD